MKDVRNLLASFNSVVVNHVPRLQTAMPTSWPIWRLMRNNEAVEKRSYPK